MDDLKETITENIQYFRSKRGMSQEKLSQMCGYSSTYIGKIERGQRSPSLDTLIRIAESLQVPINSFFDPFFADQDRLKSDWDPSQFTPYDSTIRRFNYLIGELTAAGRVRFLRHLPWFHADDIDESVEDTMVTELSFFNFSNQVHDALESALKEAAEGQTKHLNLRVSGSDFQEQTTDLILIPEPDGSEEDPTLKFELFYPRIVREGEKVPLRDLHFELS